jgi:hypothetical protein
MRLHTVKSGGREKRAQMQTNFHDEREAAPLLEPLEKEEALAWWWWSE